MAPPNGRHTQPKRAQRSDTNVVELLPHNRTAERAVLGACMLSAQGLDAAFAAARLRPEDFYDVVHGHIWQAVLTLADAEQPVGAPTIEVELRRAGVFDLCGGLGTLAAIVAAAEAPGMAASLARTVARHARARRQIHALDAQTEAVRAGQTLDLTVFEEEHGTNDDPSWRALDISAVLDAPDIEPDRLGLRRSDGRRLIQCEVLNLFIGEPESGKSLAAALSAVSELNDGRPVGWVDLEQGPKKVIRDLRNAGARPQAIRDLLSYVPAERIPYAGEVRRFCRALAVRGGRLIVIDSLGELIEGMGYDPHKEARLAMGITVDPMLAEGLTVVGIDHVVKDAAARGKYAVGDQGKTAKATVSISFAVQEPFAPGVKGRTRMTVMKDRWGHLGEHLTMIGKARVWGDLIIDSTGHEMHASVELPSRDDDDQSDPRSPRAKAERKRADRRLLQDGELRELVHAAKSNGDILTVTRAMVVLGLSSDKTAKRRLDALVEMRIAEHRVIDKSGGGKLAEWVLTEHGRAFAR